jgi:hypothetical protein
MGQQFGSGSAAVMLAIELLAFLGRNVLVAYAVLMTFLALPAAGMGV